MTTAVLLRSGMKRNFHVPFWRAVEKVTSSLTLIIMLYERAKPKIESARVEVLNLNHPDLVAPILEIAEVHGLLVK